MRRHHTPSLMFSSLLALAALGGGCAASTPAGREGDPMPSEDAGATNTGGGGGGTMSGGTGGRSQNAGGAGAAGGAGGAGGAANTTDASANSPSDTGKPADAGVAADTSMSPPPASAMTPNLPGMIDGVEPEAHAHHPPMADGKGNLYRMTESIQADGNNPRMMKSANGGATWTEVDKGKRPPVSDLEGCWQLQVGSTIHVSVSKGSAVVWTAFNTSDAASKPDEWVAQETVDSGLSSSGVKQFSSMARTSDGQFWIFYSDRLAGSNQQIAYRRRTGTNVYGPKASIEGSSGSWTAPVSVVGKGDVTHVFYKDQKAHQLLRRTLSPAGVLSESKRVDSAGTSTVAVPHTNAVAFEHNGAEHVVLAYANEEGLLKVISFVDGAAGTEEAVSAATVLQNPKVTLNESAVAHLALDGTTLHAMWVDAASGDIKHRSRPAGGSWSAETVAWSSGNNEAHYIYPQVFVRAGYRRLGFTYDIAPHPDDTGNIRYNEIVLGPAR